MVNFRQLNSQREHPSVIEPRSLFQTLGREQQYEYLRDVQGDVLDDWFKRKDEQDLVIKMNTGSGKTLVGLLLLWSRLKEGYGPALYLCPNNYLVSQVRHEADRLGIKHLDFESDNRFPEGFYDSTGILITNVQKLFNGLSVFRVAGRPDPVRVGTILIDDAHTCINTAREQFTASFLRDSVVGRRLFSFFNDALRQQAIGMYEDINRGVRDAFIRVPYWVWQQRIQDVASLFSDNSDSEELKFVWPFLRHGEVLSNSIAVISGDRIEIAPGRIPISLIPSFTNASSRVYMSATLVDDAALIKDFAANPESARDPIKPKVLGDIGERLIISPALVDSRIEETTTTKLVANIQSDHQANVVILVPSSHRGRLWETDGVMKVPGADISAVIQRLSSSVANTAILANRYDGIDLPNDACRVLVIDDLPSEHRLVNLSEATSRQESPILKRQIAQKIEQGMGRGVRSRTDHCVVILTGKHLVSFMSQVENQSFFTAETKRQIGIGKDLTAELKREAGNPYQAILDLVSQCLKRDPDWQDYHRAAVQNTQMEQEPASANIELASAEFQAWRHALNGQYSRAAAKIARLIDKNNDLADVDVGWYLQLQAEYLHHIDPTGALEKQLKAHELNSNLLKPPQGVQFRKIQARTTGQSEAVIDWVRRFNEPNALVADVNTILEDLTFGVSHDVFEKALNDLAAVIGFQSQRPDKESKRGPDVLWRMADGHYLVIEAKNQVDLDRQNIFKKEAEQLGHHITWFNQTFLGEQHTPILIHPSAILAHDAYLDANASIIQEDDLQRFVNTVRGFVTVLAGKSLHLLSATDVAAQLQTHELRPSDILNKHLKKKASK